MREKEKQIYIRHLNLSSGDPNYNGAKMLEQQAE